MTSSNDDIIKAISHYQERLERYSISKSEDKMLYVVGKLRKLPIKTVHLEATGVGRTVNGLKKLTGEVGEAAKDLVMSWKEMVLEEEKASQETSIETEEDADSVYSSENESKDCQKEDLTKENVNSYSDNDEHESEGYSSRKEVPSKSTDYLESKSNKHKYNNGNSNKDSNESSGSSESSESEEEEAEEERSRKRDKHNSRKRSHSSDSSSDDREKHSTKKNKKDGDSSSKDSHKHKHKSSKEDKDRKYEKKDKRSSSKHRESSEKPRKSSEKHRESSGKLRESSDKSESKHKSKKDPEEESRHRSKKESEEEKKQKLKRESEDSHSNSRSEKHRKHEEKESEDSYSNHKSDKYKKHEEKTDRDSKSTHSSKHKDKESSSHSSSDKKSSKEKDKRDKEKHESKKDRREEKHSEKKSKESIKEEKKSESNKSKDSPSTSTSKQKSGTSDGKEKKSKVKKEKVKNIIKEKIVNGIDSESGASFAEVLGMCGPAVSSPKKKPIPDKNRHSANVDKAVEMADPESSKTKNKYKYEDNGSSSSSTLAVPELLQEEPAEPLNICLSSLLPEITPNYKPLGLSFDTQPKRMYTDDEALSRVMTNKNQRTKVYSGNKIFGKVESLFQLCVRVLQDNIDALEFTGGVPYLILKPIMDRATPDQLFNLEHHNPYLIEDTDELWLLHCQKDFRTKKREEMESWRDMYMRCLDEREAKLNAVKANIKQSQDKSIPVRTTKMAYVDSEFVKPPRNVARKQAKNGTVATDRKTTPTQKLSAIAKSGEADKVAVFDPVRRVAERSSHSSSAAVKPKKAPLMAKTLSFLKNRFRR